MAIIPLTLVLWNIGSACVDQETRSAIYVDVSASPLSPTGSECSPFSNLTEALINAQLLKVQAVVLKSSNLPKIYDCEAFTALGNISIEASLNFLKLQGTFVTSPFSNVILKNGTMLREPNGKAVVQVAIGASLVMQEVIFEYWDSNIFEISGSLFINNCTFRNNFQGIASIGVLGGTLKVAGSVFFHNIGVVGTIFRVVALVPDATLLIDIKNSHFEQSIAAQGGSIGFISSKTSAPPFARSVSIVHCTFHNNPGLLFLAMAQSISFSIVLTEFTQSNTVTTLGLYNSTFLISDTVIRGCSDTAIRVVDLSGRFVLSQVNISDVAAGPALMFVNSLDASEALLGMENVKIWNVNTTLPSQPAGGIFATGYSIVINRLEVFNVNCALACGFFFAGNMVAIEHISVHDITGVMMMFGQTAACFGYMNDVQLYRAVSLGLMGFTQAFSVLTISNVYMKEMTPSYFVRRGVLYIALATTNQMETTVTFINLTLILPPERLIGNFWSYESDVTFINTYIPSVLVDNFMSGTLCNINIQGLVVDSGKISTGFVLLGGSFNMTGLVMRDMTIENGVMQLLQNATAVASGILLERMELGSIVQPSFSSVSLSHIVVSNSTIECFIEFALNSYFSHRFIALDSMLTTNSKMDFASLLYSELTVTNSSVYDIISQSRWTKSTASNITIISFSIYNFQCQYDWGLLNAKSSIVAWNGGILRNMWTTEQTLINVEQSVLQVSDLSLSMFNATFITSKKGSVEIANSQFSSGGQHLRDPKSLITVNGALLKCINCEDVDVSGVLATNLSAVDGGAIYAVFDTPSRMHLHGNVFIDCWADGTGGAVHSEQAVLRVSSDCFARNTAENGGALYISCDTRNGLCSSEVSNSTFDSNSATSGGAIRWFETRPTFSNNTFTNNEADYGPNEASDGARLSLLDASSLLPIDALSYSGTPGQLVPVPLLIGLIDTVGQLVATDDYSYVNIRPNDHAKFFGPSRLIVVNGVANYSSFVIRAKPGTTLDIVAYSDEIPTRKTNYDRSQQFAYTYKMRECIAGEHAENTSCYICPKSSYSLSPTQDCTKCPSSAACPGGALLDLNKGYWRSSNASNRIEKCFVEEACGGGLNSTCGEGFTSNLCGMCAPGWYRVGKFSCFKCSSNVLLFTRIVILGIVYIAFLAFVIYYVLSRSSADACGRAGQLSSLLRILLAFIQSMMLISGLKTEWNTAVLRMFEVMEFFGTLVIGSFSPECYLSDVVEIPMVYFKLILVSVCLLVLFLVIEGVWMVGKRFRNTWSRECIATIELILLLLFQPMQVKYAMNMFDCKGLDTGYWLTAHLSERCWEGRHRFYLLALALPSLLVFGGGSIALLSALLFMRRVKFPLVRAYLSSGYSGHLHYWELVCQVCKLLLAIAVGALGAAEPKIQILAATIVVFSYIYLQVIYRPYASERSNSVSQASMVAVYAYIVLAFFNHYFGSSASATSGILSSLSFLSLLVFLVLYCFQVVNLLKPREKKVVPVLPDVLKEVSSDKLIPPNNSAVEQDLVSLQK